MHVLCVCNACMHACMHACVHACMHGRMHVTCVNVCMRVFMWFMYVRIYVCTIACMYALPACMYGMYCMHVDIICRYHIYICPATRILGQRREDSSKMAGRMAVSPPGRWFGTSRNSFLFWQAVFSPLFENLGWFWHPFLIHFSIVLKTFCMQFSSIGFTLICMYFSLICRCPKPRFSLENTESGAFSPVSKSMKHLCEFGIYFNVILLAFWL